MSAVTTPASARCPPVVHHVGRSASLPAASNANAPVRNANGSGINAGCRECPRKLALLRIDAPPMIAVQPHVRVPVGDPRSLLPHEVEIFVVRELRKAGLEPTAVKVRERTHAEKSDDYVVQLGCSLRIGD